MSLFMCAHGELYSKCIHCNDFSFDACRCRPDENYYVRSCRVHGILQEEDSNLSEIVNRLRKEKIEY
jgi:hypothetical protein